MSDPVTVDLVTVWLNDAEDPTDFIRLVKLTELNQQTSTDGEFAKGASGRVRGILDEGNNELWTLTLPFNPADQITWLKDHRTRVVCARDGRGNKVFGMYLSIGLDAHREDARAGTQIEITAVTFDQDEDA